MEANGVGRPRALWRCDIGNPLLIPLAALNASGPDLAEIYPEAR